ncbi:MAG: universal stress protein [Bacteroidota bacterium]
MKNILLPTDFSNNSFNAIKYAVDLFKNKDCTFHLLNVYKVPYLTNEELMDNDAQQLARIEKELYESSQKGLDEIVKKVNTESNHNFKVFSDYNFLTNSVKQILKREEIDLIVMGTKGATGAKEIFMGSNTGDVLMKTDCSLLAVPEDSKYKAPSEITFVTDFRIHYKEELETLINLAKENHSSIRILHLLNEGKLDEEQIHNKKVLIKLLDKIDHTFHTLTNTDFETAVNCFTQSRGNIDMITIIAKHYNIFQRLFFKPKVEDLSFHTKIPLLVLHKNK